MTGKTDDTIKRGSPTRAQGPASPGGPLLTPMRSFMARLGPAGRGFVRLLVLLLVAVLSLSPLFPRNVTPASAPPDIFSGERAMAHVPIIAREPHPAGSPAQARVRDYLVQQLSAIGVQTEIQQTWGVENVVARLHGTDPTGAIVVLAHYDSDPAGSGAADNGSGVAALLEIMRALAAGPALRNDVIALFDDHEERGAFAGTRAFIREHPWMAGVHVAIGLPRAAYMPVWPVLIGSLGWIAAVGAGKTRMTWSVDMAALLAAVPLVVLFLPLLPAVVMSDGMKSLAILAGAEVLLLGVVLPAVDGLVVRSPAPQGRR